MTEPRVTPPLRPVLRRNLGLGVVLFVLALGVGATLVSRRAGSTNASLAGRPATRPRLRSAVMVVGRASVPACTPAGTAARPTTMTADLTLGRVAVGSR